MNIIEFIRDPQLIGGDLSDYQETALRLLYGLTLSEEQKSIAKDALDSERPTEGLEHPEATFICGRRSGKSDRLAANVAVFEAASGGHEKHLSPGERGTIAVIAQDMRAARVLYRYILAKLESSDLLAQLTQKNRKQEIELTNGLDISIFPCSFRATRGYSIPVAILDEVAFFRHEGAIVDKEVIDALRPAQATFPKSKLVKISSPYSKSGELYKDFSSRHKREDLLVFKAASWLMNPTIPEAFLQSERERDPDYFDREYSANFAANISNAFTREAVEDCIVEDRRELPYRKDFTYHAGVDPSGGGADEFTLSICHEEDEKVVQDCLRAYRSRKPHDVVVEMAKTLKNYHISKVTGDRYSGEWVRQAFGDQRIDYKIADLSASDAFLELLPLINQGTIELLDDKRQTSQLLALERKTSRMGKDSLGHPPGGHDDRANALAHAARLARAREIIQIFI